MTPSTGYDVGFIGGSIALPSFKAKFGLNAAASTALSANIGNISSVAFVVSGLKAHASVSLQCLLSLLVPFSVQSLSILHWIVLAGRLAYSLLEVFSWYVEGAKSDIAMIAQLLTSTLSL